MGKASPATATATATASQASAAHARTETQARSCLSGSTYVLKGNFGSEVRVILKLTLAVAAGAEVSDLKQPVNGAKHTVRKQQRDEDDTGVFCHRAQQTSFQKLAMYSHVVLVCGGNSRTTTLFSA